MYRPEHSLYGDLGQLQDVDERVAELHRLRGRAMALREEMGQTDPWTVALEEERSSSLPTDSVAAMQTKLSSHVKGLEREYMTKRRKALRKDLRGLVDEHDETVKAMERKERAVRELSSLRRELDAAWQMELYERQEEERRFQSERSSSAAAELLEAKRENDMVRQRVEAMRARIAELKRTTDEQEGGWWETQEHIKQDQSKQEDLKDRSDVMEGKKKPNFGLQPSQNGNDNAGKQAQQETADEQGNEDDENVDAAVAFPGAVTAFDFFPKIGPVTGGSTVRITGLMALHAFRTGEVTAVVQSGDRRVPVGVTVVRKIRPQDASKPVQRENRQGGAVELMMPAWNTVTQVDVQVVVQGVDLKHPPIKFNYYTQPIVTSITPKAGPAYQATEVTVLGDGLVQLVGNGVETDVKIKLERPAAPGKIQQLAPTTKPKVSSSGATEGPSSIEVTALLHDGKLKCQIGPVAMSGVFHVRVSLNGGLDYSPVCSTKFVMYMPPVLEDVMPRSGIIGEPTVVAVKGKPMTETGDALVQFTAHNADTGRHERTDVAKGSVSNGAVQAATPAYSKPVVVELAVSLDGGCRYFSAWGGMKFKVNPPPKVSAFKPDCGPASGGTEVTLQGTDFDDTGDFTVLVISGTNKRPVRALVTSDSEARFRIPAFKTSSDYVTFEVSPNNKTFLPVQGRFKFLPPLKPVDVSPKTVGGVGGMTVTVYCENAFDADWSFKLDIPKGTGHAVTGKAIFDPTRKVIEFVMPKCDLRGAVRVGVSFNGQQFFAAPNAKLTVTKANPAGFNTGQLQPGAQPNESAEWGDAVKSRAAERARMILGDGKEGIDEDEERIAMRKRQVEERQREQEREKKARMEERQRRAEELMQQSSLPPRMARQLEKRKRQEQDLQSLADVNVPSFRPNIRKEVPNFKKMQDAFQAQLDDRKRRLKRKMRSRGPKPFELITDIALPNSLRRLRPKYEQLPLASQGQEMAQSLGVDLPASQWTLIEALLQRGQPILKDQLNEWGVLAPSIVAGLSPEELMPRKRRVRRRLYGPAIGSRGQYFDADDDGASMAGGSVGEHSCDEEDLRDDGQSWGALPSTSTGKEATIHAQGETLIQSRTNDAGDKYDGDCTAEGVPNGYGVLTLANGDKFEGTFVDGVIHGDGKWTYSNGDIFEGTFIDGTVVGEATFKSSNGDVYTGGYSDNGPEGKGRKVWSDGRRYDGDWKLGAQHGKGVFQDSGGSIYEGDFLGGKAEGEGTLKTAQGHIYVGQWKTGREWGEGVCTWADGRKYTGEWMRGKKHGQGTMLWPDNSEYEGSWQNGKRHGFGAFKWPDGSTYEGDWKKGRADGVGQYCMAAGKGMYEGEWYRGRAHGVGKFTDDEYRVAEGVWVNGKLQPKPEEDDGDDFDEELQSGSGSDGSSVDDGAADEIQQDWASDFGEDRQLESGTANAADQDGADVHMIPPSELGLPESTEWRDGQGRDSMGHSGKGSTVLYGETTSPSKPKLRQADKECAGTLGIKLKHRASDGLFEVAGVAKGSVAAKAGKQAIRKGLLLMAVDGKGTIGRTLVQVTDLLAGPAGESVKLGLADGAGSMFVVSLIRQPARGQQSVPNSEASAPAPSSTPEWLLDAENGAVESEEPPQAVVQEADWLLEDDMDTGSSYAKQTKPIKLMDDAWLHEFASLELQPGVSDNNESAEPSQTKEQRPKKASKSSNKSGRPPRPSSAKSAAGDKTASSTSILSVDDLVTFLNAAAATATATTAGQAPLPVVTEDPHEGGEAQQ